MWRPGDPCRGATALFAASPATGFPKVYKREQDGIVDRAVGPHNQAGSVAG